MIRIRLQPLGLELVSGGGERLACQICLRPDAREDVELAFTALTAPSG